jgi:Hint domain
VSAASSLISTAWEIPAMETPNVSTAIRRTRRNVIAMGKLLGVAVFGIAVSPGSGEAATSGGKPCFLKGTRIRVAGGEKKIEDIRIGDLVVTKSGIAKPVRWVARRRYRKEPGSPWVENIQPVRIARDALGPNTPSSDLFISDTHALHFDGTLIQALDVLNGRTIARYPAKEFDEIEYFHVRLDSHDVIYAEGAECESLGDGGYDRFDNFIEYERLYGNPDASRAGEYAPLLGCLGPRAAVVSRLRSAASPLVDLRTKLERVRDDLHERAEMLAKTGNHHLIA